MAAAADAWGDDGSQPVRYDPIAAATEGWGDDGTQPVRYDPVASTQKGGGDDESQEVHYDPVAQAQDDWGDDGGEPVTEVPVPEDETPAAEAPADAAEEEATPAATTLDDEEGQVTEERKKWRDASGRKWWMHQFLRRRFEHGVLERNMIERYIVNKKVEGWRNLEMQRFRMHLDQQHGCINCDIEGKLGINC